MKLGEFRILAYAKSEIDLCGIDFVIVLRLQDAGDMRVKSVLLKTWNSMFRSTGDADLDYLHDFLYDLRQQAHVSDGSDSYFFQSLDDLSIGPLRTSSSGDLETLDFGLVHPEFGEEFLDVHACSEEAFNALTSHLRQPGHQFTAATKPG